MYGSPLIPAPAVELDPHTGMGDPVRLMAAALTLRDRMASVMDEANAYTLPGKPGIAMSPNTLPIYDDTACEGLPEAASRVQQGIAPSFARWASFLAGFLVPDEQREEVQARLELVDQYLFEQLAASNFELEAGESLQDVIIGTGALDVTEGMGNSCLAFRAIAPGCLLFLIGPDGLPDPIWETRRGSPFHAQVLFPGARMPAVTAETPSEVDFVECVQRDWSELRTPRWKRTVWVAGQPEHKLIEEDLIGDGANPKIVFRWSKGSGEGWGRGPAIKLLPSIRKVNFAEQLLLDAGELALLGIWTAEDDGVVNTNTVRLETGSVIPIAAGSSGLKNVAPGGNLDISGFVLDEARKSIRRGFFMDELGDPNRSPKTATEIDARVQELARKIGTPMARLIIEFSMPVVQRCVRIMSDRGLVKLPKIDGKTIKLTSTAPLAQAQRFEVINAMLSYANALNQALPERGVPLMVAEDRFGLELAEHMQVPRKVLRTAQEREKMAQAVTSMAGGQGGETNDAGAEQPGGGDEQQELPPPVPDGGSPAP